MVFHDRVGDRQTQAGAALAGSAAGGEKWLENVTQDVGTHSPAVVLYRQLDPSIVAAAFDANFAADGADMVKVETDSNMRRGPFPPNFSEIVPELGPEPTDIVVTKRNWGAFYGTALDLHLRRRGIKTIVLGGIATNMGVESTARAANEHGFNQILVEDTMASRSPEMHAFAVGTIFPLLGLVCSTEEVLAGCAPAQS